MNHWVILIGLVNKSFGILLISTPGTIDCGPESWFTTAVSAADSAGTETDRSRRLGSVSGDTRKTLHRKLKKF